MRRLAQLAALATLFVASRCPAQELGHRVLGTLGLQAGVQPEAGLYVADVFAVYDADRLIDLNGARVPGRFKLTAIGNVAGASFHYRVPELATYVSIAFSVPVARISASSDRVPEGLRRAGVADIYVQPLRLGWRLSHFDLVTGYGFYVPSGVIEADQGPTSVSRSQWTYEIVLGGTIYFDRSRSWQLSALGSVDINGRKLGIDITRGTTIQVQGGLGKTFGDLVTIGPVGYALWQVQDDHGADVPPAQVGARDRVFGVGAEVDLTLHKLRTQVLVRYAHDFQAETRQQGQILLVGITVNPWKGPQER